MSKEKLIDYKEYARQMRENCARDYNGTEPIVICSSELWEEIATIIDDFDKQSEGEWMVYGNCNNRRAMCSNCKKEFAVQKGMLQLQHFPYCPLCGARMRDAKMKGGAE